jgi:protein SCO1
LVFDTIKIPEMKKNLVKTGILMATLVLPVFVYLFLRFFSQNHFVLPRYAPVIDSLSKNVQFHELKNSISGKITKDTLYHNLPAFLFVNQHNQITSSQTLAGKILISTFLDTKNTEICSKTSRQMARVQEYFKENNSVVLLSHTVNPEYDSYKKLNEYANIYEALPQKWFFLTGAKKDLLNLAKNGYFLKTSLAELPDFKTIVLVDKQGIIRGYYNGTTKKDVDRLVLETKILLDIYNKQNAK